MRTSRIGIAMLGAAATAAAPIGCRSLSGPPLPDMQSDAASWDNADAYARTPDVSSYDLDADVRGQRVPSYDLDADVRARVDSAKSLWGPATRVDIVAGSFVIIAGDREISLDKAVALATRALDALFNDRFRERPDRAVTVTLWSSAVGYDAYCRTRVDAACGDDLGVYIVRSSEIVVNIAPGLTTLTHEIVHPIVQHDFPSAPKWLDEGIASLFEAPVFPSPGEIHRAPNWRMPPLAAALERSGERSRPRLDSLFRMSDEAFLKGDRLLHYATARAVCKWLDERKALWPFYQAWRDAGSRDADGSLAFQSVVHETPTQANGGWTRWVIARSRTYRP